MRILSIDYGKKRTGIAVTDPMKLIANGLTTVDTTALMRFVLDYVGREAVETIVIGLPVRTDGSPSDNQPRVRAFAAKLTRLLPPGINVAFYDERFTSVLAHQAIRQSGIGKKRRETDKGLVDEVSACIILQDYLESLKPSFTTL